ncbi:MULTISPECIES: carotenoid biosynthesis protein [unclassified Frankia]|uniref:carotenoid biosynthesis protein n=1 Tax=unclassified Frankia TaxID=2632575 RepID=UPI002AD229C0|nr:MULTISPECIES: carotenoid biosynthesis protein [unclassified Frankia]
MTAPAWAFAAVTVAAQIAYPLATRAGRRDLTVATVLSFAAASVIHAACTRGAGWAASMVLVTAGGGLAAETAGVHTGLLFGRYVYTDALGPGVAGVPVVIPPAWTMMAYPAFTLGRYAARRLPGQRRSVAVTALVGGWLLTTWDLFLDPQMVDAGYWRWSGDVPALNGIPLSNAAGWLVVGILITGGLALIPRRRGVPDGPFTDRLPIVMIGWTYASSLLANLVFFDRPDVALAGGIGMGTLLAAVGAAAMATRRQYQPTS